LLYTLYVKIASYAFKIAPILTNRIKRPLFKEPKTVMNDKNVIWMILPSCFGSPFMENLNEFLVHIVILSNSLMKIVGRTFPIMQIHWSMPAALHVKNLFYYMRKINIMAFCDGDFYFGGVVFPLLPFHKNAVLSF
jgi:hypothetical protein